MAIYLVNTQAQPTGEHEVHRNDCNHLPLPHNRRQLGDFPSCTPAVAAARQIYPTADGCRWCSPNCHRR